ncbi:MAG: bile acid:sodium symporter family protein [Phenylobacterium sp.]|uniref:bile acid:sodium symporter family protein n=1 Tax=Phenylobacterium sp. TaxID=1871053 RepID=UPI002734280A|nr:bile acid:sodium symporter family protein [Phenylobacterium sp.]MDP3176203.1 bile acid:sodium symporter family protein [Phenylobacterium sp.]
MKALLARLKPDLYLTLIVFMVVLASIAPARGEAAVLLQWATRIAIGFVFFFHGARLASEEVRRGLTHWRLHLLVLASTFALFPLLGLALAAAPAWLTPPALAPGVILLCCLPSTVQSSIAFTSIARGDVAAAVAAATASNILGVLITPLLVGLTLHAYGGALTWTSIQAVVLQLLVPFIAGQALRRWIGGWVKARAKVLSWTDRGAILLEVYSAFSAAVVGGLWDKVSAADLARLLALCCLLLGLVLTATTVAARTLGFNKADEIAIVFCGSKKSLASGVPMASVLFPAAMVGPLLLPLMLFHQIQLMVCAVMAQAYAKRRDTPAQSG